uniref:Uncharacterized protein n=1 Tax=Apteryx owenii TaxID=8824 RepID=A0A8B9PBV0_APTOW
MKTKQLASPLRMMSLTFPHAPFFSKALISDLTVEVSNSAEHILHCVPDVVEACSSCLICSGTAWASAHLWTLLCKRSPSEMKSQVLI